MQQSSSTINIYSPQYLIKSALRNQGLIRQLVKQEIVGRYRGSLFGVFWSFLQPLFMLLIFTVVFGKFFQARWGNSGSTWEFALVLFVGLIIFNLFSECATRAPSLISSNPNFVKKVIFPLEILPIVTVGSAFFHALVSLAAWLCFYLFIRGVPPVSFVFLPLILLIFLPVILGFCWFLAAASVFLKVLAQIMWMWLQAYICLSPVFYSCMLFSLQRYNIIYLLG